MIFSDKQRRISTREAEKLKKALSESSKRDDGPAWLQIAEMDAIRSEIARLEIDIADYDMLKAGEISFAKSFALESLPSILVQARIAAGLSQTALAAALKVKPQQVQRYEATGYLAASLSRLIEVSEILGVHAVGMFGSERASHGGVFSWGRPKTLSGVNFRSRKWLSVDGLA